MKKFTALITSAILAATSLCATTMSADALRGYQITSLPDSCTFLDDDTAIVPAYIDNIFYTPYQIFYVDENEGTSEMNVMFKWTINYTSIKIKTEDSDAYEELFEKYREQLAFDYVCPEPSINGDDGTLTYTMYYNGDGTERDDENFDKIDLIKEFCKEADSLGIIASATCIPFRAPIERLDNKLLIKNVPLDEEENLDAMISKYNYIYKKNDSDPGVLRELDIVISDSGDYFTCGKYDFQNIKDQMSFMADVDAAYPDADAYLFCAALEGDTSFLEDDAIVLVNEEGTDVLYGDVNLDKTITMLDYVYLCKYNAKLITLNEQQLANADCTANGTINASDELALMRFLIEEVDSLPALRDDE